MLPYFYRPDLILSQSFFFFFNDTATTEIYTLSLHDALPIYRQAGQRFRCAAGVCHPLRPVVRPGAEQQVASRERAAPDVGEVASYILDRAPRYVRPSLQLSHEQFVDGKLDGINDRNASDGAGSLRHKWRQGPAFTVTDNDDAHGSQSRQRAQEGDCSQGVSNLRLLIECRDIKVWIRQEPLVVSEDDESGFTEPLRPLPVHGRQ